VDQKDLHTYQREMDRHARRVLERAFNNDDLIQQMAASFDRIDRGEPAIPLAEIKRSLEDARAGNGHRSGGQGQIPDTDR
jgi:hypothetical protein